MRILNALIDRYVYSGITNGPGSARQWRLWVVYLSTADNSNRPKIRYNAPVSPRFGGATPWSHTFFTTNWLCWPSYGSLSCGMSPGPAEGLRYHRQPRLSNPSATAL